MDEMNSHHIAARLVVHIGGFDPVSPDRLNHRLVSGLAKFSTLWSVAAKASAPEQSSDGRIINWHVEANGPNWSTQTDYTILRWDDLIEPYVMKVWWRKIIDGYAALLHFTLNGTIWRYFATNKRYGIFVLYPFFLLVGIAAISALIGSVISDVDVPYAVIAGVLVGIAVFVSLLRWSGSYFHLYFALADWSFAADMARDRLSNQDECLEQFSGEVISRLRNANYDEVILSGVSLGAVMMVEALTRVLARSPDIFGHGPPVSFLTIGSSILKIGLHPKATRLKSAVDRVAREASLFWVEYQSKVDPINFYKTDPVTRMGLASTGKPIVKTIHIRKTMTAKEYRSLKTNFLRLHRQFAMPNSQRYFYDFYLICFGPMPLAERVALGAKATVTIGEDGTYRAHQPAAADRTNAMATS